MLSNDNFPPFHNNVIHLNTDTGITAEIKDAFQLNQAIKKLNISVITSKGKVTLSGNVPNFVIEEQIIALTKVIPGVKEIVSHLRVLSLHSWT